MALKSGLAAQWGIVPEVTYSVPVVVTRFQPFASETVSQSVARMESKAIISGRRTMDTTQWASGDVAIAGTLNTELFDHSMGTLWAQCFGGTPSITGSNPYTTTYTPGDLTGKSMTWQFGRPSVAGTVQPFTYPGVKVQKWTLSAAAGQIATLAVDVVGYSEIRVRTVTDGVTTGTNSSPVITSATAAFVQDDVGKPISGTQIPASTTILSVQSATSATMSANATAAGTTLSWTIGVALAAVSYTTQNPVSYVAGSFSIGGVSVPVKSVTLSGDNKLDAARRFVGSVYISEPHEIDQREYLVDFMPEYTDNTLVQRFVTGATGALVFSLASGANTYTFTLNVRFDGDTPNVAGTKILDNHIKAKAIGTTDAAAITLVTVNTDAAL